MIYIHITGKFGNLDESPTGSMGHHYKTNLAFTQDQTSSEKTADFKPSRLDTVTPIPKSDVEAPSVDPNSQGTRHRKSSLKESVYVVQRPTTANASRPGSAFDTPRSASALAASHPLGGLNMIDANLTNQGSASPATRPQSRSSVVSKQGVVTSFSPRYSIDEGSRGNTIPSVKD